MFINCITGSFILKSVKCVSFESTTKVIIIIIISKIFSQQIFSHFIHKKVHLKRTDFG
jgi:hypothetical protein